MKMNEFIDIRLSRVNAHRFAIWTLAICASGMIVSGCGSEENQTPASPKSLIDPHETGAVAAPQIESAEMTQPAEQEISGLTMTGYNDDGSKSWELVGEDATVENSIVKVRKPDAIGFGEDGRTAFLTAEYAHINQGNRQVWLENAVTIHTNDGLWLTSPYMHWFPDKEMIATDRSVRLETDHMLLRGRGGKAQTELKHVSMLTDIEMVLNPTENDSDGGPRQVFIVCDGPLEFDYENNIAVFHNNVHVTDINGEIFGDKLVAYMNTTSNTIKYAEITGNVRIVRDFNVAHSQRAVYEPDNGKITLVGRPTLTLNPDNDSSQLASGGAPP